MTLTWKAPTDDGGSPITDYIVEMKSGGGKWTVVSPTDDDDDERPKVTDTTFTVGGIVPERECEFRVRAVNKAGPGEPSEPSKAAKYVEEIVFLRALSDVKLSEANVDVTFECEISKEGLKLDWTKGEKKISPDADERYAVGVSGKVHKLTISKANVEDIGDYTATYSETTLWTSAKLSIAFAPQVLDVNKLRDRIVIKAGSSTVVEVPFAASPKPWVEWKYNDCCTLPDVQRFKVVDTVANMVCLSIATAVRGDSGTYTVSLENDLGKTDATVELVVQGRDENCCVKRTKVNTLF
jgi:titin